ASRALALRLDDVLLLVAGPLFLAFVLGGPPSPTRNLVLAWSAYYLFMVVVVFHTESRYRAPIAPFVLAGAAGGMAGLLQPERRRVFAAAGLLAGLALSLWLPWPYAVLGARALAAPRALAPLGRALDRGALSEADRIASEAAGRDPGSARPWFEYGRALAAHDRAAEAVVAYRRGRALPALDWTAQVVLPRLLHDAGRPEEAEKAVLEANKLSWDVDPWILLEVGGGELPPRRAREVRLAQDDYGAVRGFFYPH